jgi:hypothetical protein
MSSASSPTLTKKPPRTRYSDELKQEIRRRYPLCRTTADKEALAQELGVQTLHRLYNLASRLGVTREYGDWYEEEEAPLEPSLPTVDYDPSEDQARLRLREDPTTTIFSARDDEYLRRNFGQQRIEEIAYMINHTESATMYRARKLGLRGAARSWEINRVCAWLGITRPQLERAGRDGGLVILPCCDSTAQVRITLVETESLARTLLHDGLWRRLRETHAADEWFLREIIECYAEAKAGKAH